MSRIVSVWLPRWPIQRFLTAQQQRPIVEPVDPERPLVLTHDVAGVPRVAALNAAADANGVAIGDTLADARAKADGQVQVHPAMPAADDDALRRLALWATRYTPAAAPFDEESGADGFFLDVTGAAHLFGGEHQLIEDLAQRLTGFGLTSRLAIADTPGAAWALSRYHLSDIVLPSGLEPEALAPLPIDALRLTPATRTTLRRLGFKRIGALIDKPRAPLAARFEPELLQRLDQALGRTAEPLTFIAPLPIYHSLRYLLEPIAHRQAVLAVVTRLMKDLVHPLLRDGVGARSLRLALYRVDGAVTSLDIGFSLPTRDPDHVARLIDLKLERLSDDVEIGFGYEALGLAVMVAEPIHDRQMELTASANGSDRDGRCAALIDSLSQRLGPRSVRRLAPVASHRPEQAECVCAPIARPAWPTADEARPRPVLLLPRAEPAEVMAMAPEGPPRRFRWRNSLHNVARTQGPERIADEWWRHPEPAPTRDYYVVEDTHGHRFWLYREGLYGRETMTPRWFVHGLLA